MKCEECLPLIEEYVDRELGERASREVAAHLATCRTCADEAAELEREQEMYARYRREVEVKPAHWNILRAAIEQEKEAQAQEPRPRFLERLGRLFKSKKRFRPALVLALLLIFVGVTAAIIYNSRRSGGGEIAVQSPKQEVAHPPASPPENRAPENGGHQVIAQDGPAKDSNNQTGSDNSPRNSPERRAVIAVKRTPPAPQRIKQTPDNDAPRFEEVVADTDDVMTSARLSTPVVAGDLDSEIARHAEKTELLLRSFRNARPENLNHAPDVSYERGESRKLLYQNITLRRDAEARGDQAAGALLNALEPILLDIAHLSAKARPRDVLSIQRRIRKKEIVAALQVRALVASN